MQPVEQQEDELVGLIKNGNEIALDLIMAKYGPLVSSIARRYFLLGADNEDLIQEGMIGLHKACISYSSNLNSSFKAYASLCINRQIQSAVKIANRQKNFYLNNALSLDSYNGIVFVRGEDISDGQKVMYIPTTNTTPESELIEKEEYDEMINKIKKSLSKDEFEILSLYLDGFKCGQIAQQLNKNYKSVDNALFRIKTKLRFLNGKK